MAPTASTFSLGPQLTVRGGVSSKGPVHVSGEVIGDIDCSFLLLSPQSILKGNVVADDVIVQGQVTGIVRACRVILQAGVKLKEIYFTTLSLSRKAPS
jgi:cytoskeletal protein CcmA (bactofilin family)